MWRERSSTRPRSSGAPTGGGGVPPGSEKVTTAAARSRPPSVAGVPSATTSPRAMTTIRSASRSASSM